MPNFEIRNAKAALLAGINFSPCLFQQKNHNQKLWFFKLPLLGSPIKIRNTEAAHLIRDKLLAQIHSKKKPQLKKLWFSRLPLLGSPTEIRNAKAAHLGRGELLAQINSTKKPQLLVVVFNAPPPGLEPGTL
jgi:hypothetical protein